MKKNKEGRDGFAVEARYPTSIEEQPHETEKLLLVRVVLFAANCLTGYVQCQWSGQRDEVGLRSLRSLALLHR